MTSALALDGIVKAFEGRRILDDASFHLAWGEVHALLGENGAGKSSLMSVASGLYAPDEGTMRLDGTPVSFSGPNAAKDAGIGMVHQHFKLVGPFTVAENIMLANPQRSWRQGLRHVKAEIARLSDALRFDIDPDRQVSEISVAEQQRAEIVKVLVSGARILILDEPTAVLTDEEADRLLATMRGLADEGRAVVLITHKLREAPKYADKVTVMRAGRTVATAGARDLTPADLTRMMVGDSPADQREAATAIGEVLFDVEGLQVARDDGAVTVDGLSLNVRAGEIYAVAGVGGNGQTELAEALTGIRRARAGDIRIDRAAVTAADPRRRRRLGLVSVPADRSSDGLANDLTIRENYAVGGMRRGRYGNIAWTRGRPMTADTEAAIAGFDIQGARPTIKAGLLSGGNAQKLVLARELNEGARVIVAHSPTRGLDVRACTAIHDHLRRARDGGAAVLVISEDLDEVLNLADRIGVMTRGRIVGEFEQPADRHAIGALMVDHG